jgi:hypothetical protein
MYLRVCLVAVGVLFSVCFAHAFHDHFPKQLKASDYQDQLDSLEVTLGSNKTFPPKYKLACLLALSGYPELKTTKIDFISARLNSTMAARPRIRSMFRNRKKRGHKIYINTDANQDGLLLSEVSFNAQVGVIAHELGHIAYYTNKSAFSLMGNSAAYLSKKYRGRFERDTDQRTIEHGFGWQLVAFIEETLASDQVPEEYKTYKQKVYYTPEKIREEMKKLNYN